jgi:cytochrome c-type biogenesis protein CcmF
MANVGYVSLIVALLAAVFASIAFGLGARRAGTSATTRAARSGLLAVSILVTLSSLVLMYALFSHDFHLEYVASYSSLHSAPIFLLSALWAGNSGSLLLWTWLLSLFSLAAVIGKSPKKTDLLPYAGMVLMVTESFFLILLVFVINPFNQLSFVPQDGLGLNPMLQNMGMVFHPPALLAGYVGFTVPFAFAVSALLMSKTGGEWLVLSRRWMLVSWLLLGIGNIIGAWWAYVELGWGGYWAWDPVENAGLMPWLLATALLHSSVMQRRKGAFKVWSMVLVILTFCLVMFGTFLTRSGMLSSVHTFNDGGLTPFFVVFIAVALFGPLLLLYYRYEGLRSGDGTETLFSRESTFLWNNVLLVVITAVILLGTIFPAISEAVRGVKLSLNSSFFNQVVNPLFLAVILLAGLCVSIGWKSEPLGRIFRRVLLPLLAAALMSVILLAVGVRQALPLIAFFVAGFVLFSMVPEWLRGVSQRSHSRGENLLAALWKMIWANPQRYGGYIVHLGIVVMAIGIIGSSFYGVEKEGTLKVGDSLSINQYTLTFNGLTADNTPDNDIVSAKLTVYESGVAIGSLNPQKYFHKNQEQPVTEVAIRSTPFQDLYVILEGWSDTGSADFKVLINPLVSWIWIGGGVFLLGGLVAFWPRRRRPGEVASFWSGEHEDDTQEQGSGIQRPKQPVCPRCGATNPYDSRFCSKCGSNLVKGEKKNGTKGTGAH